MTRHLVEHFFESPDSASVAAAAHIGTALKKRLSKHYEASLVVTGGKSPLRCYQELAASAIDWPRIHILLSDERWVPVTDANSNERLVRDSLLVGKAASAQFLPTYRSDLTVLEQCHELGEVMPSLPLPFACTLLGMGDDGHIASLFQDAEHFAAGIDADSPNWFVPVTTATSPHPRISMTLATLLQSEQIVLLFFGAAKRDTYEQAKSSPTTFPISTILSQDRTPVHVFWAA